ncbi:MAG: glucose-6-phosphate isomerase [Anaerolineae bacterium]
MVDARALLQPSGGQLLSVSLGAYSPTVEAALAQLEADHAVQRVWQRDGSLWSKDTQVIAEVEDRLGWLALPEIMRTELDDLEVFAENVRSAGIGRIVLLGMGGSSLAPEVMARMVTQAPDAPELVILDTTDPTQIRTASHGLPLERTLFVVSSKSGTTAETLSLYAHFKAALMDAVGAYWPAHFVAITDPGTKLETLAREEGWRGVFINPPDIGGRYSALSFFGLVPATLAGIDTRSLLTAAASMAERCRNQVDLTRNPGIMLGAIMGALARHPEGKRDKLTLLSSPIVAPFAPWAEQLIAESTGKQGVGILPVEEEFSCPPEAYGSDRLFVYLRQSGAFNRDTDARVQTLMEQGQPVVITHLNEAADLGAQFLLWEFATAIAGRVLGVNPFDQPDVEAAKKQARAALQKYETTRHLPEEHPSFVDGDLALYGPACEATTAASCLRAFFSSCEPGDYVAIMAYIERAPANDRLLEPMRTLLCQNLGVAVTLGYGPRFLHSTGQLHKGGPNTGLFLQVTRAEADDLPVPGTAYTFGILKQSQALGDMHALRHAGRRVLRVHLGGDLEAGLRALDEALRAATQPA